MIWLAIAIIVVGYLWYRTKVDERQQGNSLTEVAVERQPLPVAPTRRLSHAEWPQVVNNALERTDWATLAQLVGNELQPALSDVVEVQAAAVEHMSQHDDDAGDEWTERLAELLQGSLDALHHVALVVPVAIGALAVRRGEFDGQPTACEVDPEAILNLAAELHRRERDGESSFSLVLTQMSQSAVRFAESATAVVGAQAADEALHRALLKAGQSAKQCFEQTGGVNRYLTS